MLLLKMISIIRPVNGIIGFVSVLIGALLSECKHEAMPMLIITAGIVCFLIISAGNILNDCIDVEIDKINKPNRPIPAGKIGQKQAIILSVIFFISGILISISLGFYMFIITVLVSVLLVLYNTSVKKYGLSGNILVAFLGGLPFVFGGLLAEKWNLSIIPFAFAFLVHLAREMLKDVEDVKGDKNEGVLSIPIKHGKTVTIQIASAILALLVCLTPIPFLIKLYGLVYLIGVIIFIDIPIIFVIYKLLNGYQYFQLTTNVLKFVMVVGLGVLLLGII